jgi:hypothetical protein
LIPIELKQNNLFIENIKINKHSNTDKKIIYYVNNKHYLKKKNYKTIDLKNEFDLLTKINIGLILGLFYVSQNIIIKKNNKKKIKVINTTKQAYENDDYIRISIFDPVSKFKNFTLLEFYNNKTNMSLISKITKKKLNINKLENNINLINTQYSDKLKIYKNITINDDILLKYTIKKYLNFFEKIFFIILSLIPKFVKKIIRKRLTIKYSMPLNRFSNYDNYLKIILKNVF